LRSTNLALPTLKPRLAGTHKFKFNKRPYIEHLVVLWVKNYSLGKRSWVLKMKRTQNRKKNKKLVFQNQLLLIFVFSVLSLFRATKFFFLNRWVNHPGSEITKCWLHKNLPVNFDSINLH
jgi:hypothetical protein